MDKLREGTPAITVGGEPLEDHLEREEGKEKADETEESRKQEIGIKTKHKKKFRPRERFEDDPSRVSKRVRHMSDWEIRKEYGVKEKPFPTLNQNVMYVLYHAGDTLINTKAISDELGKPLADVSSALSNIWKKLKDERIKTQPVIFRKRVGLAFQYRFTDEGLSMGFEELFRKYFGTKPRVIKPFEPGVRSGPYAHGNLPYKRSSKNVIELIARSMGEEFAAREIANGVGKPAANISSTLQMVIKRLNPHNMLILSGSRATRLYRLHPDLAGIKGEDLLTFIQSPKRFWAKDLGDAWAFWHSRGYGVDPKKKPEPSIPPPPDPAEEVTVTAAQVTKYMEPLLQRIQALEQDGLEDTVEKLRVDIVDWKAEMFQKVRFVKEEMIDKVKSAFPHEPSGKFDLNINVRFLLR